MTELKISVYVKPDEYEVQMFAKLDKNTYRKLMELLTNLDADVVED